MAKIKIKRTSWTILIIVVALVIAAIFYTQKQNFSRTPEDMKEVKVEESLKAEEAKPTTAETDGPREYTSEYFTEKDRFNAIGVSWEEASAGDGDISLAIRIKNNGVETEWFTVYKNFVKTAAGITYYTAESPILSRGDEYQYRVTFAKPANEVRNIKFDIINTMGTSYTRFIDKVWGTLTQDASAASWNPAGIISRATWGGSTVNASATLWPPQYAEKSTKFVVHHTVGTNYSCASYSQDEAEADVKAIWQYHTYGNDWGDIGYNYLVDPCGRVYEGRLGGNNVIAGHASPYNYWDKLSGDGKIDEATIGVSILGDYSHYVPEGSAFEGFGRILGYKSYINAINPLGASTIKDKYTYNIAGHRDYWYTACPGAELYARLSSVRSAASAHKSLYLADYGDYETTTRKIVLNTARVSMENVATVALGDFTLAKNPAIGEPITMISSVKNTNTKSVTLENVRVVGILDNGTEFTFGQTPSITIGAGQIGIIPTADYNITSFRYQTFKITYELHMVGPTGTEIIVRKEPTISTSYSYPSIVPHRPDVKITNGPLSNPSNPILNVPATVSYTLKNYDVRPAYLRNLYVKTIGKSVINTKALNPSKVDPSKSYTYSDLETFGILGKVVLIPFYTYGNGTEVQGTNIENKVVSNTVNVLSESADYSKINLYSFKATMEDATTPLNANDFLLASKPAIGEPITIRSSLKNVNNYEVTLGNVRIRGHLDSGTEFTVGTVASLVIPANTTMAVTAKTFNITSSRVHSFYLDFQADGKILRPTASPTYSYQQITAHFPNVKVVKTPVVTPTTPLVKNAVTVTYKLKNYDSRPAYLRDITILTKLNNKIPYYFPKETKKIVPGEVYQYSRAIIPANGGIYYSSAQITYGNGTMASPAPLSTYKNTVNFKVYTETIKLQGPLGAFISIPAVTGGVGIEQHLAFSCQESAIHHYNSYSGASYVPNISFGINNGFNLRNGMAWVTTVNNGGAPGYCGYGAFGESFNSLSTADKIASEKYYINMRWSYASISDMGDKLAVKDWHFRKKVIVTNPVNGKKIVASIIEYGPAASTGKVAGLSPEGMYALGINVNGQMLNYAWAADQTMPLGPIN